MAKRIYIPAYLIPNTDEELEKTFDLVMAKSGTPKQTKRVLEMLGYIPYPRVRPHSTGGQSLSENNRRALPTTLSETNGFLKTV